MSAETEKGEAVDPTILTGVGAKAVEQSLPLLQRVLGPSADVLGEYFAQSVRRRFDNSLKVARAADRRIGEDEATRPVSLRVANRIFEESAYCEDDIVTEYLGGVLESSRKSVDSADLGNTYAAYVSRLSVDHLYMHYMVYAQLQRLLHGMCLNLHDGKEVHETASLFISSAVAERDLPGGASPDSLYSILGWLKRDEMIAFGPAGEPQHLRDDYHDVPAAGVVVRPTALGCEMYMWGLGKGNKSLQAYFSDGLEEYAIDALPLQDGYQLIRPKSVGEIMDERTQRKLAGRSALDIISSMTAGEFLNEKPSLD